MGIPVHTGGWSCADSSHPARHSGEPVPTGPPEVAETRPSMRCQQRARDRLPLGHLTPEEPDLRLEREVLLTPSPAIWPLQVWLSLLGELFFFNLSPLFCLPHPHCLHPQVPHQRSLPLWQELSIPVPASFSSSTTPSHPCWAWLPKATLWCHLSAQSPLAPAHSSQCGVTAPCLVSQALCTPVAASPWHLISLWCSTQLPRCVW